MKRIDLHIHTVASDGMETPAQIVARAREEGLAAIAITDHDTVDGFQAAYNAAQGTGLEVVPGIELGTAYKGTLHILGYYIDLENRELKQELQGIVEDRDVRNEKTVALMRQNGLHLRYEDMKVRFGSVVGKPHFAEILVEFGFAEDIQDAISRFLQKGRKYWIPRKTLAPERCIELILNAGGIPVIAHPFEYKYENKSLVELIEFCMAHGLKGLECRHSNHSPGQMAYLQLLADEYGLVKTGGSDYHGSFKPDIRLGTGRGLVNVPYSWLEELKKLRK